MFDRGFVMFVAGFISGAIALGVLINIEASPIVVIPLLMMYSLRN